MFFIINKKKFIVLSICIITLIISLIASSSFFIIKANRTISKTTVKLPVVMYHHILKSPSKLGNFTISPSQLEDDLKYIKKKGYTPVTVQQLIDFVYQESELPEKPILLTFDDGYRSNYVYAFELLKKYKMPAVLSCIGKYIDVYEQNQDQNVNYAHCNWKEIKEMMDSGLIYIGNHTYNMHGTEGARKGVRKSWNENDETFKKRVSKDIMQLQNEYKEHLDFKCELFAYPFGYMSDDTERILKELEFKITLSCESGVNEIDPNDKNTLFKLKRNNRIHNISTYDFFKKILE